MNSALKQVMMTYVRPRRWRVVMGACLLLVIAVLFTRVGQGKLSTDTWPVLPIVGMAAFVGAILGNHLKDQFAHPRARLTPGFAAPHLTAGAIVGLVTCAGLTGLSAWAGSISPAGPLAFIVVMFTGLVGFLTLGHIALLAVPLTIWMSLMASWTSPTIMDQLRNVHPVVLASCVAVSAVVWIRVAQRLAAMEESDRVYAMATGLESPRDAIENSRKQAARQMNEESRTGRFSLWLRDRLYCRFMRGGADTTAAQIRRLRLPMFQPLHPWVISIVGIFYVLGLPRLFGVGSINMPHMLLTVFIVIPGFAAATVWRQRMPMIATESLLPMQRDGFVKRIMACMGLDIARAMTITTIVPTLVIVAFEPQARGAEADIATMVAIVGLLGTLFIAASLWLITTRSNFVWWFGQLVSIEVMISCIVLSQRQIRSHISPASDDIWLLSGIILLLLSGLIAASAYRRWMRMEFGR